MEQKIRKPVDEVIDEIVDKLLDLDVESEEYSSTLTKLERAYKLKLEEERIENEAKKIETEHGIEKKKFEATLKLDEKKVENESKTILAQYKRIKAEQIDRWLNFAVQIGLAIGGWTMYSVWQEREQLFELHGTPTSQMFRNLLSSMTPKMKK